MRVWGEAVRLPVLLIEAPSSLLYARAMQLVMPGQPGAALGGGASQRSLFNLLTRLQHMLAWLFPAGPQAGAGCSQGVQGRRQEGCLWMSAMAAPAL